MVKCTCDACRLKDDTERLIAVKKLVEGTVKIETEDWDWECGDGCCSDYGTYLYINGYLITDRYDNGLTVEEFLDFMGLLNKCEKEK